MNWFLVNVEGHKIAYASVNADLMVVKKKSFRKFAA